MPGTDGDAVSPKVPGTDGDAVSPKVPGTDGDEESTKVNLVDSFYEKLLQKTNKSSIIYINISSLIHSNMLFSCR